MGQCRCNEGKFCGIHFFRKSPQPEKYQEEKKKFESKKKRVPEYDVDTDKHPEFALSGEDDD